VRPTRGDGLLTGQQLARMLGRSPNTIYSWAFRGYIEPDGLDEHGRPLYRRETGREAERQRRQNGLEASGVDPRTVLRSRRDIAA
jgi:hypothetical protein